MPQSKKPLESSVAEILLHEWDPIGVKNVIEAQDEYDTYIFDVCSLIRAGRPVNEIQRHLIRIVEVQMGLDGNVEVALKVAKKLSDLKQRIQM